MIVLYWLLGVVILVLGLYQWAIIISVVLSWLVAFEIVNMRNKYVYLVGDALSRVTEPALRPIRRFLPNLGGIDLSPLVLLLAIWFLQGVLSDFQFSLGRARF